MVILSFSFSCNWLLYCGVNFTNSSIELLLLKELFWICFTVCMQTCMVVFIAFVHYVTCKGIFLVSLGDVYCSSFAV